MRIAVNNLSNPITIKFVYIYILYTNLFPKFTSHSKPFSLSDLASATNCVRMNISYGNLPLDCLGRQVHGGLDGLQGALPAGLESFAFRHGCDPLSYIHDCVLAELEGHVTSLLEGFTFGDGNNALANIHDGFFAELDGFRFRLLELLALQNSLRPRHQ